MNQVKTYAHLNLASSYISLFAYTIYLTWGPLLAKFYIISCVIHSRSTQSIVKYSFFLVKIF